MKNIPDHIFRGYDLRGEVDKDLDVENVEIIGKAYATWLLERRIYDCVVGYDCRHSSESFRDALVKGLTESGISVFDIGMTLTQIAYFAQYIFRTRGMVMITASHNPKEYNGFKFGTGFSETMLTDDIHAFRALAQSDTFKTSGKKGAYIKKFLNFKPFLLGMSMVVSLIFLDITSQMIINITYALPLFYGFLEGIQLGVLIISMPIIISKGSPIPKRCLGFSLGKISSTQLTAVAISSLVKLPPIPYPSKGIFDMNSAERLRRDFSLPP